MKKQVRMTTTHRYWLRRTWDETLEAVAFVMLNPSTADAVEDDPTIRRCIGFAKAWGYGGIEVVNVYNLRATNPKELWNDADLLGLWTRETLAEHLDSLGLHNSDVVAAWGNHAKAEDVLDLVGALKDQFFRLQCLGTNKNGSPKHPLYLKADTIRQPWSIS